MEHVGQTTVAINAIGEHGRDDVGELRPLAVRRDDKPAVDLVELCGGELVDSSLLVRIGNAIRELGCDVGLETSDLDAAMPRRRSGTGCARSTRQATIACARSSASSDARARVSCSTRSS